MSNLEKGLYDLICKYPALPFIGIMTGAIMLAISCTILNLNIEYIVISLGVMFGSLSFIIFGLRYESRIDNSGMHIDNE